MNRETWLNDIAKLMEPRFIELGYELPKYRVTIGFTSGGKNSRANGQCFSPLVSRDSTYEIVITILEDDPQMVACILAHELIHTAVGFEHGHKGKFVEVAKAIGLQKPWTASVPTEAFNAWADPIIEQVGPLPHARLVLNQPRIIVDRGEGSTQDDGEAAPDDTPLTTAGKISTGPKKQTTRLVKVDCEECGFLVRMSQKWIDEKGFPHCPEHGAKMGYADGSGDKENDE